MRKSVGYVIGAVLLAAQAVYGSAAVAIADPQHARHPRTAARGDVVRQIAKNDCGLAAFATLARRVGVDVDLVSLARKVNLPPAGASLAVLSDISLSYGIHLRAIKVGPGQVAAVPRPWIAHLNWRGGHFVVVDEVSQTSVTVADPARGVVVLPMSDFAGGFTGYALMLGEPVRAPIWR